MIHTAQIEVTNLCNAHCLFCPRDKIAKFGEMSRKTLGLIVEHFKGFYPGIKKVVISGFGEPFRTTLIDRLRIIRNVLPDVHLSIFTNGSQITEWDIKHLKQLSNLDINISLNGPNQEVRQKLMGLDDFDKVLATYYNLIANRIDCSCSMVAYPIISLKHFNDFAELPNSQIIQFQSFGGLSYPYRGQIRENCERKESWLTFNWQGKQIKCCFDINGKADCSQCTEGIKI